MNILVTGGAGFIGSHIVDQYVEAGHRVVIVDNLSTGSRKNLHPDAELYEMDIRDPSIGTVFQKHDIEIVNHHAAQIDVRRSVEDPQFDLSVNVLGTINILEAAVRHSIRRFIFASSGGAVYGEQTEFPADENHATAPCSPYGITKLCVEKYLHYYHLVNGLQYTAFRYTNVYGPRQNPHGEAGVVAIFARKLLSGEHPIINGDGLQTRDFVYVQDVVRANLLALEMQSSEIMNIATGREVTVNEIFRSLNSQSGAGAPELHGEGKAGEQQRSVCSHGKAKSLLGWTPATGFEEGLMSTLEYFKSHSA